MRALFRNSSALLVKDDEDDVDWQTESRSQKQADESKSKSKTRAKSPPSSKKSYIMGVSASEGSPLSDTVSSEGPSSPLYEVSSALDKPEHDPSISSNFVNNPTSVEVPSMAHLDGGKNLTKTSLSSNPVTPVQKLSQNTPSKKRESDKKKRSLSVGAVGATKSKNWTLLDTRMPSQPLADIPPSPPSGAQVPLSQPSSVYLESDSNVTPMIETAVKGESDVVEEKGCKPTQQDTKQPTQKLKSPETLKSVEHKLASQSPPAVIVSKKNKTPAQDSRGKRWIGGGGVGWADRVSAAMLRLVGGGDGERQGWVIKATSAVPGLPKPKHVRNLCIATWDGSLTPEVLWSSVAARPWKTQPIVAMKVLALVLRLFQQGSPSVRQHGSLGCAQLLADIHTHYDITQDETTVKISPPQDSKLPSDTSPSSMEKALTNPGSTQGSSTQTSTNNSSKSPKRRFSAPNSKLKSTKTKGLLSDLEDEYDFEVSNKSLPSSYQLDNETESNAIKQSESNLLPSNFSKNSSALTSNGRASPAITPSLIWGRRRGGSSDDIKTKEADGDITYKATDIKLNTQLVGNKGVRKEKQSEVEYLKTAEGGLGIDGGLDQIKPAEQPLEEGRNTKKKEGNSKQPYDATKELSMAVDCFIALLARALQGRLEVHERHPVMFEAALMQAEVDFNGPGAGRQTRSKSRSISSRRHSHDTDPLTHPEGSTIGSSSASSEALTSMDMEQGSNDPPEQQKLLREANNHDEDTSFVNDKKIIAESSTRSTSAVPTTSRSLSDFWLRSPPIASSSPSQMPVTSSSSPKSGLLDSPPDSSENKSNISAFSTSTHKQRDGETIQDVDKRKDSVGQSISQEYMLEMLSLMLQLQSQWLKVLGLMCDLHEKYNTPQARLSKTRTQLSSNKPESSEVVSMSVSKATKTDTGSNVSKYSDNIDVQDQSFAQDPKIDTGGAADTASKFLEKNDVSETNMANEGKHEHSADISNSSTTFRVENKKEVKENANTQDVVSVNCEEGQTEMLFPEDSRLATIEWLILPLLEESYSLFVASLRTVANCLSKLENHKGKAVRSNYESQHVDGYSDVEEKTLKSNFQLTSFSPAESSTITVKDLYGNFLGQLPLLHRCYLYASSRPHVSIMLGKWLPSLPQIVPLENIQIAVSKVHELNHTDKNEEAVTMNSSNLINKSDIEDDFFSDYADDLPSLRKEISYDKWSLPVTPQGKILWFPSSLNNGTLPLGSTPSLLRSPSLVEASSEKTPSTITVQEDNLYSSANSKQSVFCEDKGGIETSTVENTATSYDSVGRTRKGSIVRKLSLSQGAPPSPFKPIASSSDDVFIPNIPTSHYVPQDTESASIPISGSTTSTASGSTATSTSLPASISSVKPSKNVKSGADTVLESNKDQIPCPSLDEEENIANSQNKSIENSPTRDILSGIIESSGGSLGGGGTGTKLNIEDVNKFMESLNESDVQPPWFSPEASFVSLSKWNHAESTGQPHGLFDDYVDIFSQVLAPSSQSSPLSKPVMSIESSTHDKTSDSSSLTVNEKSNPKEQVVDVNDFDTPTSGEWTRLPDNVSATAGDDEVDDDAVIVESVNKGNAQQEASPIDYSSIKEQEIGIDTQQKVHPRYLKWDEVMIEEWRAKLVDDNSSASSASISTALDACLADFHKWGVIDHSLLKLVRQVGSGGCAHVYLGHLAVYTPSLQQDTTQELDSDTAKRSGVWGLREVALKKMVIPSGTATPAVKRAVTDFHSEAKMLQRLSLTYGASANSQGKGSSKEFGAEEEEDNNNIAKSLHHQPSPNQLQQSQHPCIVALLGCVTSPLSLVFEYCGKGNLMKCLADEPESFPWPRVKQVALQVASGIQFLHAQSPAILHRDLKSLNILLDKDYNAKVSDFGLSRFGATSAFDRMTAMCGTYHWMAPEVMNATPESSSSIIYGPPVDVFSFAIILWELATKQLPYDGWAAPQVIVAVAHRGERLPLPKPTPNREECVQEYHGEQEEEEECDCPVEFLDLIEACWAHDPNGRPTFSKIVELLDKMN